MLLSPPADTIKMSYHSETLVTVDLQWLLLLASQNNKSAIASGFLNIKLSNSWHIYHFSRHCYFWKSCYLKPFKSVPQLDCRSWRLVRFHSIKQPQAYERLIFFYSNMDTWNWFLYCFPAFFFVLFSKKKFIYAITELMFDL